MNKISRCTDTAYTVSEYVRQRNEALRTLDLAWARRQGAGNASDEVLLMGMHKARYEATGIAPELRQESRRWLEERGLHRLGMIPWPKDGSLPT